MDGGKLVNEEVQRISKAEARAAMKRIKSIKVVGPDDKPVEVWRSLGERAVESNHILSHS